jgi:predicted PurR-regulated permease PerM
VPFVLLLLAVTGASLILKTPVRNEATRLIQQVRSPGFTERLADWRPLDFPIGEEILENHARILSMLPQLGKGLRFAEHDMLNLFIIPILSFFMLKDGRRIRDGLLAMVPDRRQAVENILDNAHTLMLRYMRGLLTLCLTVLICFSAVLANVGVTPIVVLWCLTVLICFSAVLSLMGVHYSLLLALLASPLEFVPVVGPLTSSAVIIGVSAFNKYPHIPALIAFLILYRLFQDYVISPI